MLEAKEKREALKKTKPKAVKSKKGQKRKAKSAPIKGKRAKK